MRRYIDLVESQTPAQTLASRVAAMGLPARVTIHPLDATTAEVTDLQAAEPGKGQGRTTMKAILDFADELGVTLELWPMWDENVEGDILYPDQLEDWYVRLGFQSKPRVSDEPDNGEADHYLVRKPRAAEAAFSHNRPFPENTGQLAALSKMLRDGATPIKQVQEDITLYRNNEHMFIANADKVIGFVKLVPEAHVGKTYVNLELIYVYPEFRGTNAKRLLLYAVKEETSDPVIADGAIFKDGQRVLMKLLSDPMLHVQTLNKRTGAVTPCTGLINDADLCYLLKETRLGYGKQYLPEGFGFTWFAFMEHDM